MSARWLSSHFKTGSNLICKIFRFPSETFLPNKGPCHQPKNKLQETKTTLGSDWSKQNKGERGLLSFFHVANNKIGKWSSFRSDFLLRTWSPAETSRIVRTSQTPCSHLNYRNVRASLLLMMILTLAGWKVGSSFAAWFVAILLGAELSRCTSVESGGEGRPHVGFSLLYPKRPSYNSYTQSLTGRPSCQPPPPALPTTQCRPPQRERRRPSSPRHTRSRPTLSP